MNWLKMTAISIFIFRVFSACVNGKRGPGSYSTHPVIVRSGEVELSARIYQPEGDGPFPAVVMVHGSKNHIKDYYTEYSRYFASSGIVTVNYDKRGQGASSGDLWTSTFLDLALDAVSLVDHLKTLPYVDRDRIGLWADSQGGWIILLADSLSSDIAFMINKSGPAMSPLGWNNGCPFL